MWPSAEVIEVQRRAKILCTIIIQSVLPAGRRESLWGDGRTVTLLVGAVPVAAADQAVFEPGADG